MKKVNILRKSKQTGIITLAVVSGLVVGGLGITRSEAAMDWLGLEQKLENHDQQLDNHDDRITNVEKGVETVQEKTETTPAPERVVVREVVTQNPTVTNTPEPTPAPEPKPVTVTSFEVMPNGDELNCKYTYSDKTSKVFRWRWSSGVNQESTNGRCDADVIGLPADSPALAD